MHSVLSLQIHLRVPIRIEDDDCVCCLKVQTQPSSPSAEQKDVELTVWLVEELHPLLSIFCLCRTIKPKVPDTSVLEIRLHDVHEMSHLREDEHAMPKAFEFGQNAIDELKLA